MERYLIAIDLDGTLIMTLSKGIHPFNKIVIQRLVSLGHVVIFATGRPIEGCREIYKYLDAKYPIICDCGSTIYHTSHGELVIYYSFEYRESALAELFQLPEIVNNAVSVLIQNRDCFYVTKINVDLIEYTLVEKFCDFIECPLNQIPLKGTFSIAVLFRDDADLQKIISKIEQIQAGYFHSFEVRVGRIFDVKNNKNLNGFRLIDITIQKHSKAEAIEFLRQRFDIPFSKTIVIGDSDNDLSAIKKFSSQSVAMANATRDVLQSAKFTTKLTNDEGGVGEYLNQKFKLGLNLNLLE